MCRHHNNDVYALLSLPCWRVQCARWHGGVRPGRIVRGTSTFVRSARIYVELCPVGRPVLIYANKSTCAGCACVHLPRKARGQHPGVCPGTLCGARQRRSRRSAAVGGGEGGRKRAVARPSLLAPPAQMAFPRVSSLRVSQCAGSRPRNLVPYRERPKGLRYQATR